VRSGFSRFAIRAGLAVLGTALFCGGALVPGLAVLSYVALVPWAVLYMGPQGPRVSPLYAPFAGYLCFVLCYRPIFGAGGLPSIAAPLFFVPAWLLFPLLARPIQRLELPRSITLPVVWVAVEWARLLTAAGHFDLLALGYSQAGFAPLVQVADVTGVYGISFLVAAVNGLLADAFFTLRGSAWRPRVLFREPRIVVPAAVIAATFAAVVGYGVLRLETSRLDAGPRWAVLSAGTSAFTGDADLLVWPAGAILDDIDRKAAQLADSKRLAGRERAFALIRARGHVGEPQGGTTTSLFLVDRAGSVRARCDKRILFPFSEYVPLDRVVGAIAPPLQRAYRQLVRKVWASPAMLTRGSHVTLFDFPWRDERLSFAPLIGAEGAYPALLAEAGRQGARFVVTLTGEGDVGGVAELQWIRVCRLRAIENRIALVLAGAAGGPIVIDPLGRLQSAPADTVALAPPGTTAYAASHDAFALLCVAVSLWLLARALLGGRATMTPIPLPAGATI
jgi:apolipoprotein N-acyltransferase